MGCKNTFGQKDGEYRKCSFNVWTNCTRHAVILVVLPSAIVAFLVIASFLHLDPTGAEETEFKEPALETHEKHARDVSLEIAKDQDLPITPSEIGRFSTPLEL